MDLSVLGSMAEAVESVFILFGALSFVAMFVIMILSYFDKRENI